MAIFLRNSPSVMVFELARSFDLDVAKLSLISSAFMLSYGSMQIPAGLLADAIGGRKTIAVFLILLAAGMLLFACSWSPLSAAAGRFICGLGAAVFVPSMLVLSRTFSPQNYACAGSALLFCGNIGILLAASPLVLMLSCFSWRSISMGCCLFCLLLACLIFLYLPRDHTRAQAQEKPARAIITHMGLVMTSRGFAALATAYTFHTAAFMGFISFWWNPLLIQGCGVSDMVAGNIMLAGVISLLLSYMLWPFVSSFLRNHARVLTCSYALGLGAVLCMMLGMENSLLLVAAGGALLTMSNGAASLEFASLRALIPIQAGGTAAGIMNAIPFLLAGPFQWFFGYILSLRLETTTMVTAYRESLYVYAAFQAITLIASFFLHETYYNNHNSQKDK